MSVPREEIGAALGSPVDSVRSLGRGDINQAWRVTLADGREVFVKTHASTPPPAMFEKEARGLEWLAAAEAIAVPRALAFGENFLALPYFDEGQTSCPDFAGRLGRELAALHRAHPGHFGLDHDNYLAVIEQDNTPEPDWPSFFERRRLRPFVARAVRERKLGPRHARAFERLYAKLDELWGDPEPPARLHGDLWGGNLMRAGVPTLIDPAVFGGHREIDLGMMRLFGGFSERTFDAYAEEYPLSPGAEDRVPLSQLIPLLVHVLLFGGGYVASLERALGRYVGL